MAGLIHKFEQGPLIQNFLDNLLALWTHRFIERCINYDGNLSIDDRYKEWIQLQKMEKNAFVPSRGLDASSSQ